VVPVQWTLNDHVLNVRPWRPSTGTAVSQWRTAEGGCHYTTWV